MAFEKQCSQFTYNIFIQVASNLVYVLVSMGVTVVSIIALAFV